jgi:hypothetical protein
MHSSKRIAVLAASVALVGIAFFSRDRVRLAYYRHFVAPELEQKMGFRGETADGAYTFSWVDPHGILGRAGVKAGYGPCFDAHNELEFISYLQAHRGVVVRLGVCRGYSDEVAFVRVPPPN